MTIRYDCLLHSWNVKSLFLKKKLACFKKFGEMKVPAHPYAGQNSNKQLKGELVYL